ncbi:MAG: DNA repair protein RecN [Bacteroidia bacterium]|nr:DNA repair protein RecN [Bacteroidia bacterium]
MLQALLIQNYALIDNLQIGFKPGFSTITGETGAGKSILMGALSLILGQRADLSLLKNKEKKCIVEGTFLISDYNLESFFKEHDLDFADTLLIRREIAINGNSRAFVNDTPVNLNIIKELGLMLVDIHSQHENLLLSNGNFQLSILDALAGNKESLETYKKHFETFVNSQKKLKDLQEKSNKNSADNDYFQFQLKQLEEANLHDDEVNELEKEKDLLSHFEEILENFETATRLLSEDETPILSRLKELRNTLENLSKNYPDAIEWKNRIDNNIIDLKDIASEIGNTSSKIDANPNRLSIILERLDEIYSLQQKHRVNTIAELISIREDFRNKIQFTEQLDEELKQLEESIKKQYSQLDKLSKQLSEKRKKSIKDLEKKVIPMLKVLGILNADFKVELSANTEFSSTGKDIVKFMFSANKKVELMEISKVASGGELSRLMLTIKSLVADSNEIPSIIFDEIDAGVSGEIAFYMSEIMQNMAKKLQVISITHLPQIASRGTNHYLVYKDHSGKSSETHIRLLNKNERIAEIAKMLSGKEVSEAALENARNLLKN